MRLLGALLEYHLLHVIVSGLVELQEVFRLPRILLHFFQVLRELLKPQGISHPIFGELPILRMQLRQDLLVSTQPLSLSSNNYGTLLRQLLLQVLQLGEGWIR